MGSRSIREKALLTFTNGVYIEKNKPIFRWNDMKISVILKTFVFCSDKRDNVSSSVWTNSAILPPPWLWHRYGNLHTLPSPTQKPTQVSRYWALLSHLGLSPASSFSILSRSAWEGIRSSRPGFGSLNEKLTMLASAAELSWAVLGVLRFQEDASSLAASSRCEFYPTCTTLEEGLRYLHWPMVPQLSAAHYGLLCIM